MDVLRWYLPWQCWYLSLLPCWGTSKDPEILPVFFPDFPVNSQWFPGRTKRATQKVRKQRQLQRRNLELPALRTTSFPRKKNAFPADGNFGLILHQNGLTWIQRNYNTFNHCRTLEKAAVAKACERHRLIDFDAVASQLPAAARAAAVASVPRCLCCIFLSDLPVQHCMTATFDVQRHIYSRARFPISRSLREADFSGISCVQGV